MKKQFLVFAIFILSIASTTYAQKPSGYFYFQPNIGVTQYFGDLNKFKIHNNKIGFGASGIFGYQITSVFGLRGQLMYATLSSQRDDLAKKLGVKIFEASGQLVFNINEIFAENPDRIFNIYAFGGGSFISTNTTLTATKDNKSINQKNTGIAVPVGLGASFKLNFKTDLNIEYGHRLTLRDTELDLTPGGKSKYDQYSYISLGLTFKLQKKDTDGDGIEDDKDICPTEPGKVELQGCPDRDDDGIMDAEDDCPDLRGKPELKGCPDSDGDGIIDTKDACPNESGKATLNGCPDKDGDGIADKDDKCPDQAGKAEFGGCPDRDGDGIPDKDDKCPDEPGLAKNGGCPIKDTDGDGVNDEIDRCPTLPGPASNQGCPEVKKEIITRVQYVAKQIQFQSAKAILLAKSKVKLNDIVKIMKEDANLKLSIEGHTDNVGDDELNQTLSENRAEAVKIYLLSQGISENRLTAQGYGESRPIETNKTSAGRALNRRVELHLAY